MRSVDDIGAVHSDLFQAAVTTEKYRACATSAMREATNGEDVIEKIKKESGIQIDIIDGKTEAKIIASTDLYEIIEKTFSRWREV